MFPPKEVQDVVSEIAFILVDHGQTIAVSESACGGLISSYLVSLPGASKFFVGGTTTYALKSRLHLSGWSEQDIATYTGPSKDVAMRLARNLKAELGATFALGETGWAGPAADNESSVGSVYFGIAGFGRQWSSELKCPYQSRGSNMEAFALGALRFLLKTLKELEDESMLKAAADRA